MPQFSYFSPAMVPVVSLHNDHGPAKASSVSCNAPAPAFPLCDVRTQNRMQFLYHPLLRELTNVGISRICCHALKDSLGNCMRNCRAPAWRRRRGLQDPSDQAPRNLLHLRGRSCPRCSETWTPDVTNVVKSEHFQPINTGSCYKRRQTKPKTPDFWRNSGWIDDVCNNHPGRRTKSCSD